MYDHGERERITVSELASLLGVRASLIHRLVDSGIVDPVANEPELTFRYEEMVRVKKIFRMKWDLGVNFSASALILQLVDRIDQLEKELESHRHSHSHIPDEGYWE